MGSRTRENATPLPSPDNDTPFASRQPLNISVGRSSVCKQTTGRDKKATVHSDLFRQFATMTGKLGSCWPRISVRLVTFSIEDGRNMPIRNTV